MTRHYRRHHYHNPNRSRHWTPYEESELKRLWQSGVPISQIAQELHRNRDAIPHKLIKLGININAREPISREPIRLGNYMNDNKRPKSARNNASTSKLPFVIACVVIVGLLLYIFSIQNHLSTSSVTTVNPTQNSTAPSPSTPATSSPTTTIAQAVDNPTNYHGHAPVVFTQSTTLTGDIVTSGNITIL